MLNEHEDYFSITEKDGIHTLSNRIALKVGELAILPLLIFVPLMLFVGWFPGLVAAFISGAGYGIYRYAASRKYTEFTVEERSGKVTKLKKFKTKILSSELISEKFSPENLSFEEITRSGNSKFLLKYKSHKEYDLLIVKTQIDKNYLENYFKNNITIRDNEIHR